jgi:hypothetical protein
MVKNIILLAVVMATWSVEDLLWWVWFRYDELHLRRSLVLTKAHKGNCIFVFEWKGIRKDLLWAMSFVIH